MKTTSKEAENTVVYVVVCERTNWVYDPNVELRVEDYCIENTTLFKFVMQSAEETTSPRGVENKLHVRVNEEEGMFEVWDWGFRGQYPKLVVSCETAEEADDEIFNRTYDFDFTNDDQRNTCFHYTLEDAVNELEEILAEKWGVDREVAKHLMRKSQLLRTLREEKMMKKQAENNERMKIKRAENDERVTTLAAVYAGMIEPKCESFKDTAARLGEAIGDRIEGKVFYKAVKLVRERYGK